MTFKRLSFNSEPNENLGGHVAQKDATVPQNGPQKGNRVPESVSQNSKEKLQDNISEFIRNNSSISRDEIATQLNISSKTVGRYLAKMGVYWEGHPKTGHWVIPDDSK